MIRLRIELAAINLACVAVGAVLYAALLPLLMPIWIAEALMRSLDGAVAVLDVAWRAIDRREVQPFAALLDLCDRLRRRRGNIRYRLRGRR